MPIFCRCSSRIHLIPNPTKIPLEFHLVGGWAYPSEKWWSESQLGWWHSQYDGKVIIQSCSSHHQPPMKIPWESETKNLTKKPALFKNLPSWAFWMNSFWMSNSNSSDTSRLTSLKKGWPSTKMTKKMCCTHYSLLKSYLNILKSPRFYRWISTWFLVSYVLEAKHIRNSLWSSIP